MRGGERRRPRPRALRACVGDRQGGAHDAGDAPTTEPISTLVDGGDIASRVRSLLDDASAGGRDAALPPRAGSAPRVAVAALAVGYAPLLRVVHVATEILVRRPALNLSTPSRAATRRTF